MKWFTTIIIFTLLIGCSVKYSFTGASISPDVKTFSVTNFENVASRIEPSLSNTLTEALKDKFLSETNLSLVRTNADLSFEGKITDYSVSYQSVQANEVAAMNRLTITIQVAFKNAKEPLKDFDSRFSRYSDFSSSVNLDEVEAEKIKEITEQLVDDIFLKSVADW